MATFDNSKRTSLKSHILKSLPKGFKCSVSKTGVTVKIWADTNKFGWDKANKLVYDLAKKLKLVEVANADLTTGVRDWELIDVAAEKKMVDEANAVYNAMKRFFAKYGNECCSSDKCYDVIDQMLKLIVTDEN